MNIPDGQRRVPALTEVLRRGSLCLDCDEPVADLPVALAACAFAPRHELRLGAFAEMEAALFPRITDQQPPERLDATMREHLEPTND